MGEQQLTVAVADGIPTAMMLDKPPPILIARVRLSSGRLGAPVILHEEEALRRAAPAHIDRRLLDWLETARDGFADLLDLAPHVHFLFLQHAPAKTRVTAGGSEREMRSREKAATSYATAAAFRRAMTLMPANGRASRTLIGDAGLLQILAIIQRGFEAISINATENRDDER